DNWFISVVLHEESGIILMILIHSGWLSVCLLVREFLLVALNVPTGRTIPAGMGNMGYPTEGKLTFHKNKFSPQWRFIVHTIMHCLSTKSGSWDQFRSSLPTALICLTEGRKFNWSSYIFKGMVNNITNPKKFLMFPRFLQMILNIETMNSKQYHAFKLTIKMFANMRLNFHGDTMPLLATMLPPAQPAIAGESSGEAERTIPHTAPETLTEPAHSHDQASSSPRPTTIPVSAQENEQGPFSDPNPASSSRPHASKPKQFISTNVEDDVFGDSVDISPPRSTEAPPAGTTSGGSDPDLNEAKIFSSILLRCFFFAGESLFLPDEEPPVRERSFRQREEDRLGRRSLARRLYEEEQADLARKERANQHKANECLNKMVALVAERDLYEKHLSVKKNQSSTIYSINSRNNEHASSHPDVTPDTSKQPSVAPTPPSDLSATPTVTRTTGPRTRNQSSAAGIKTYSTRRKSLRSRKMSSSEVDLIAADSQEDVEVGTRRKQFGQKGVHPSRSSIPIKDGDPDADHKMCIKYVSDTDLDSDDDTPINLHGVVDWEFNVLRERSCHLIGKIISRKLLLET
ncbi:hypothetical protein Tco_0648729, partial [Tanacetum coccineum]